ncbi:MAG: hypothetical protein QM817_26590 [Archangium sp.]
MKELSNQARAALEALGSPEPTAADERRVREGFERAIGVALPAAVVLGSATVASSATAAGMSSGGGAAGASAGAATTGAASFTALGVGAKVMLFVAAVGLGSVATVGVQAVVPQPAPVRSVVKPAVQPVAPAPARVVAPAPVVVVPEPIVVEDAPANVEPQPVTPISAAPKFSARSTRDANEANKTEPTPQAVVVAVPPPAPTESTPELTAPPPPNAAPPTPESATTESAFELVVEAHFPSCDASTELRTALAARRLLRETRAEHALFLIGAYQKHCPSGQWSDEAWRVRLSSLCSLGRNTEAASLWEWFASEYPKRRFAIESELRSTCDATVLEHEASSGE